MDRSIQELTWEHDAIIDSSSDGLFVCDGAGLILRVNPASQRINNATGEQLVGRSYLDVAEEGLVILPSAALEAIKSRSVVSLLQENRFGRKLISTAMDVDAVDKNTRCCNCGNYKHKARDCQKGKGKGSKGAVSNTVPLALQGFNGRTTERMACGAGQPICFAYNLPEGCTKAPANQRCERGWHFKMERAA